MIAERCVAGDFAAGWPVASTCMNTRFWPDISCALCVLLLDSLPLHLLWPPVYLARMLDRRFLDNVSVVNPSAWQEAHCSDLTHVRQGRHQPTRASAMVTTVDISTIACPDWLTVACAGHCMTFGSHGLPT